MSDFDFDELDKAVSGALDRNPRPGTSRQFSPISERPDTSSSSSTSSSISSHSSAPIVPSRPEVTRPTPAARRSAGRFMDMVHPSSDMRAQNNEPAESVEASKPASEAPSTSQPVAREQAVPKEQPEVRDELDEFSANLIDDWTQPLESPFLPGAKVEKRPLGGEAPTAVNFDTFNLLDSPDELLLEEPDEPRIEATTMPDPIEFSQQTAEETPDEIEESEPEPFELTPALAAEASDETAAPKNTSEQPYNQGAFQPAASQEPVGPISITQQYKEKAETPVENGAIYDTESYHRPLTHTPAKKTSLWIIVWIVLLILLGGGAGAALYFFVSPMV